jgi:saccharopine dehydrogenase-like NADP-dependent oxidoreductase
VEILESVPVGTSKQDVLIYFRQVTEPENIRYFTRENSPDGNTVSHSLEAGEAGYYIVGIPDVQRHRWWPSFGRHLSVIVVLSDDKLVSEIKFFGARIGWP